MTETNEIASETSKRSNKAAFDPIFEGSEIVGVKIDVKGSSPRELRFSNLSGEIVGQLIVAGTSVKSKQFYNECKGSEAIGNAVDEFIKQMESGTWNSARETGGLLARALAEAASITIEQAKEKLDGLTNKERERIKTNAKVAAVYNRLVGADDDKLLADLGL